MKYIQYTRLVMIDEKNCSKNGKRLKGKCKNGKCPLWKESSLVSVLNRKCPEWQWIMFQWQMSSFLNGKCPNGCQLFYWTMNGLGFSWFLPCVLFFDTNFSSCSFFPYKLYFGLPCRLLLASVKF